MYSDEQLLDTARTAGLVPADAADLPRSLRSKAAALRQADEQPKSPAKSDDLVVHVAITRGGREIHSTSFTIPTGSHEP